MAEAPLVEMKHVYKRFGGVHAVEDVTVDLFAGEVVGLVGHNGAGKSSTIHCITGIAKFTEGEIAVMGHDVQKDYQKTRASTGLSPQEFNVDIFAKIEKNVNCICRFDVGLAKFKNSRRSDLIAQLT